MDGSDEQLGVKILAAVLWKVFSILSQPEIAATSRILLAHNAAKRTKCRETNPQARHRQPAHRKSSG